VPRARPEPSRGARTLRTALVGVWRPSPFLLRLHGRGGWNGAPDVDSARGSKNSKRGDPELGRHAVVAQATIARPKRGQPRRSSALKGTRTPREDLPGLWFRESGRTGKTPRPSRTARGERWKPTKALPGRQHKPLKGKRTPREPGRARVTVLARCDEAVSLWRGRRQEPQRAVTRKGDGRSGRPAGSIT
jgi:hypothetical protein